MTLKLFAVFTHPDDERYFGTGVSQLIALAGRAG